MQQEVVLNKTIEALRHCYNVIPDPVSTGTKQD